MTEEAEDDMTQPDPKTAGPNPNPTDYRAIIALCSGLFAVLMIALIVVLALPGDVPTGKTNTDGQNAVAVGTAAFTAISTLIAAYFGVKVANNAREDASKARDKATKQAHDSQIRANHLAAAIPDPAKADAALTSAVNEIKRMTGV